MKKLMLFFAIIFAFLAPNIFAQNVGVGIDVNFWMQHDMNGISGNIDDGISLTAFVMFRLDELIELTPLVEVYLRDECLLEGQTLNIGGGSGLYFHLLRGDVVELSAGPKLMFFWYGKPETLVADSFTDFMIRASMPVILDLKLSRNFIIRLTLDLIGAYFRDTVYDDGTYHRETVFNLVSFAQGNILDSLHLGLCFMF